MASPTSLSGVSDRPRTPTVILTVLAVGIPSIIGLVILYWWISQIICATPGMEAGTASWAQVRERREAGYVMRDGIWVREVSDTPPILWDVKAVALEKESWEDMMPFSVSTSTPEEPSRPTRSKAVECDKQPIKDSSSTKLSVSTAILFPSPRSTIKTVHDIGGPVEYMIGTYERQWAP